METRREERRSDATDLLFRCFLLQAEVSGAEEVEIWVEGVVVCKVVVY